MKLSEFRAIPLLRRYIVVDLDTGDVVRHEVRRDPASGLTLKLGFSISTPTPQSGPTQET